MTALKALIQSVKAPEPLEVAEIYGDYLVKRPGCTRVGLGIEHLQVEVTVQAGELLGKSWEYVNDFAFEAWRDRIAAKVLGEAV